MQLETPWVFSNQTATLKKEITQQIATLLIGIGKLISRHRYSHRQIIQMERIIAQTIDVIVDSRL